MLIDWFTVGAQALNFIILVWLMKHFLYQPILNAIGAREKKIAAELADAEAKRAEAKKDRDEFQHKNEVFDQQRAALLTKATDEAKAEGQRLLDDARRAADVLSAKRQESLRSDARSLNRALARLTQEEVFAIARKALADLATTSLEERMGEVFTRRLREMDGKAKETMGAALKTASESAVVRSAFDLPAEERAKIQNAINETFSADIHLRFETAPDLVGGIELTANGQKVAWSIADYIASLEKGVGELLKQQDKPEPKPNAQPPSKPEAKSEPKAVVPVPAAAEVKGEPAPKTDGETKAEPTAEAKPKTAATPEATTPPQPETKAEAGAKPAAAEVKAGTPKPEAAATPAREVTAESAAKVKDSPARAATPDPQAASKPATGTKPKTEADDKPAPEPKAKAEPVAKAEAAPASAASPAPTAASEPATDAKPEPAEAAPVGS
jgi:F-type H+-transporting ATPase subunit b